MRVLFYFVLVFLTFFSCDTKKNQEGKDWVGNCMMTVNEKEVGITFLHQDTAVALALRGFDPEFRKINPESGVKIYQFSKGFQVDVTDEENVMVYQIEKKTVIDTVAIFDVDTKKELTNIVESEVYDTLGACRLGSFKMK
jgi:hypothetical protein